MFQVSLLPGISTNGMHPGGYHNYFSLNLTSGYAASTRLFGLSVISSSDEESTSGLHVAGLANLTGVNAFAGMQKKEQDEKVRKGFEANLAGIQISGLSNVVLNNVFGGQITGGVNVSKGALQGLQLAGLGNIVYKYSFALQLAGLWNISFESMDGVQVSSLANFTRGGLFGFQVGLYNRAGFIEGRNSYENDDPTALQAGLFNQAGKMNGFQVGLVNIAGTMQGTQIGLINIYRNGKQAGTRDGTAIGLLNFGNSGYASLYANELFFTNIELATGNSKNGRITSSQRNIYILNALIYANDPGFLDNEGRWAFGYGLKKFYFNRSSAPGMNNFRFLSFGMDALHLNHEEGKLTRELSLLLRPKVSFGTRLHPKLKSIYIFGGISYNLYLSDSEYELAPEFLETSSRLGDRMLDMWPGFSAGVHVQ